MDGGLSTLCHSCRLLLQQKVLNTFPGPGYFQSVDGVVWLWHPLGNLYIWLTISSCYAQIPLALGLIMRDGGFSTLCHNCGFACHQRVLITFPGRRYFHSEDGIVWLWHPFANLYIWVTISSCYGSNRLVLVLISRDGGSSTLCHSCGFPCQRRVLKTFRGPGYLHSNDGLVLQWHPLVNLYIWLTISFCYGPITLDLGLIVRDGGLSTLCHSCRFPCQQRVLKSIPGSGSFHSEDGVVWLWHPPVNLYVWPTISSCYGSIPLALGLIVSDGSLSTLWDRCGFACQQRVLKRFPASGYLHSEDGVVWPWHALEYLYIWLTISSCYGSIHLALGLIGRDVCFSTLSLSFRFFCQQRVLKSVSWPSLCPLPGWGSLTMTSIGKFLYMPYHFILLRLNPFGHRFDMEGWWFEHYMS